MEGQIHMLQTDVLISSSWSGSELQSQRSTKEKELERVQRKMTGGEEISGREKQTY